MFTKLRCARLRIIIVAAIAVMNPAIINAGTDMTGQAVYDTACAVCHGLEGEGAMPGVPDFTIKDSVLKKSEAELVQNTIKGLQSPGSPLAMPPKGGNPALTEKNIIDAIRYMRATFWP